MKNDITDTKTNIGSTSEKCPKMTQSDTFGEVEKKYCPIVTKEIDRINVPKMSLSERWSKPKMIKIHVRKCPVWRGVD